MAHRYAIDYQTYFGPPEQWMYKHKGRVKSFYLPFLQPAWNDPQHDHHVKRWRFLVMVSQTGQEDAGEPNERSD